MKNLLYLLTSLFISICFFNCSGGKSFEIKGVVANPTLDGEYVYLQKIDNDQLVTVDSALVKDQRFTFKGHVDSAVIREISYGSKGNDFTPIVFVLQKGSMKASVDTFSTLTGTPDNIKLQTFHVQRLVLILQHQYIMAQHQ